MGNSHAIWDHTALPATRQRWESRLYPHPKQVHDLATPEGCKAELTYVAWKLTGRDVNPQPVNRKSNALPLSHHARVQYSPKAWWLFPSEPCSVILWLRSMNGILLPHERIIASACFLLKQCDHITWAHILLQTILCWQLIMIVNLPGI